MKLTQVFCMDKSFVAVCTRFHLTLLAAAFLLMLNGCANAVSYHHSERISITLESKSTEPTAPIQGNIGAKVRTVLVTPGKNVCFKAGDDCQPGESLSVISDFRMIREPNDKSKFASTSIQSAFMTGKAAVNAPPASAKAIAGAQNTNADATAATRMSLLFAVQEQLGNFVEIGGDEVAKQHLALLNSLEKQLPTEEELKEVVYYSTPAAGKSEMLKGLKHQDSGFNKVVKYEAALFTARGIIDNIRTDRSITLKDKAFSAEDMKQLEAADKVLEKLQNDYSAKIGNSNIIDDAVAYIAGSL